MPRPATAQEKDSQQERSYIAKQLDRVRTDLKDKLKDKDLMSIFSPKDTTVTAIHLTVTRRGNQVREVQVYVTRSKQTGKKLIKILDDSRDPDFQTLVRVLKLSKT
jgi:hypothetical protein